MSGLRRFVEERMQLLEKAIDQCFAHVVQPLQEGVRNARASYRRILGAFLVVSNPFQGKPLMFGEVCLIPKLFFRDPIAFEGKKELEKIGVKIACRKAHRGNC